MHGHRGRPEERTEEKSGEEKVRNGKTVNFSPSFVYISQFLIFVAANKTWYYDLRFH
jgi:hypothetical protein